MKEHLKIIVSWFLVPWCDNLHMFMCKFDAAIVSIGKLILIFTDKSLSQKRDRIIRDDVQICVHNHHSNAYC